MWYISWYTVIYLTLFYVYCFLSLLSPLLLPLYCQIRAIFIGPYSESREHMFPKLTFCVAGRALDWIFSRWPPKYCDTQSTCDFLSLTQCFCVLFPFVPCWHLNLELWTWLWHSPCPTEPWGVLPETKTNPPLMLLWHSYPNVSHCLPRLPFRWRLRFPAHPTVL